jgi:Kef-type K+ transport system membrane component KefB
MLEIIRELIGNFMSAIPHELIIFVEIGVLVIIAAIFAYLVRLFKQPLILSYIITGILIGPLVFGFIQDPELVKSLSEIGVAFLIFSAGLEIKLRKLKEVGSAASIGGTIQVAILFGIGFLVALFLGLTGKAPIYIGIVVAFSSTMVVLKMLSDRRELSSLHGRLIIGILLIQDIAAIAAITLLSSEFTAYNILISLGKALVFVILAIVFSKISNQLFKESARTPELLILVSISFLFLFSIASAITVGSLAIGAFFAGVALANSDYKTEISGKISPIRDFFAAIFFIALGLQITLISKNYLLLLGILLIIVLTIKPLIIMYIIRFFGYKKRTSFFTGNDLAQTSEFSLIIATLGFSFGDISQGLFSALILLTIITMALTNYFIRFEKSFYNVFSWVLKPINKRHNKKEELEYFGEDGKRIILFGCHRMGSLFLKEFEKEKKDVIVIDYNPEIIKSLIKKKIPCIYGDLMNDEVLEKVNLKSAEMIISTTPDLDDNLFLIRKTKKANKDAIIFVVANRISEAKLLYSAGADYVIMPQVAGGVNGFNIIKQLRKDKSKLKQIKKEQQKYLDNIHNILY